MKVNVIQRNDGFFWDGLRERMIVQQLRESD